MVDWEQWQTLLAVSRFGTHSRAARSLRIDPTTVGRRLKLLERRVGAPLLLRQDGRLRPTSRCEALLAHLETASEALRAAEQVTATADSGAVWRSLRLTAAPLLINNLFAPAVGGLTAALRVRIELLGATSNASLTRREADIAVRIDDQPADPSVIAEPIGRLAFATYCAAGRDPGTLPWAALTEEFMGTAGGRVMARLAGPDGFQYRAGHYDPLIEIARSGLARALLPCFAAEREGAPRRDGALRHDGTLRHDSALRHDGALRRVGGIVMSYPLWLLYHRQDSDVPHLKAARAWIKELAADLTPGAPDSDN